MKLRLSQTRRAPSVLLTILLLVAVLVPNLFGGSAAAAGQVTTRSMTMSSSQPSATGVSYTLAFTPATNESELIIDFCSNSPLISDTCSFTAATVPDVSSAGASTGTLTKPGTGTPKHTLDLTGLTLTAGTPFSVTFTNVTNPATTVYPGTFYARILTYATSGSSAYVPANTSPATPTLGSYVDYGGLALSTAQTISITSKVFETLTFCVFKTACGTAPTLTLGDTTTGALSTSSAYVNADAQYTLASNAANGITMTMTGQTLCRAAVINFTNCPTGASSNTISAIGTTAAAKSLGTEQFGMCVDKTGAPSGTTVSSAYTDSVAGCHGLTTGILSTTNTFGFDDTSSTGTNSSSGSTLLTTTGGVPTYTANFGFLGDIASTTEAGLYQSNLNLVATAKF